MQGMAAQDPFTDGQPVDEEARQEAVQSSGPCTEATANGMPEGGGHDHTVPEQHPGLACRIEQVATLSLKKELADSGFEPGSILGEMDVRNDVAAVSVAFPDAGILFFDVSNPAVPKFLSAYKGRKCDGQPIDIDCGAFVDLSVDGKVAFLSVQNLSGIPESPGVPGTPGVEVVDIRDPRRPQLTQSWAGASGLTGVHTSRSGVVPETGGPGPRNPGEYVFATRNFFGVSIGEVIRPGGIPQIIPVGEIRAGSIHDSFVQEDPLTNRTFLYIADGFGSGFKVYDVTNPASPTLLAQWDLTPECADDWYSHTIDVATRNGKRYVTLPAELFDGGEASEEDIAEGCNEISGSSNVAGPMWIVDATDLGSLAQGTSDPEEKQKSEAALVATWRNPAGRAGGNLTFSPHNQQIVGDKIYLSNYHGGVIALDATKAFDGVREPRASERPVEVGFKVPDVLEQRPAFQSFTNPVVPFFVAFPLGRPHVWDMVVYKGCILSQDMTGGLYSLRETDSECGATSSVASAGQGTSGSSTSSPRRAAARRCSTPRGRLRPRNIGVARLGRTRAAQRRGFVRTARRRKVVDRFCLTDGRYIRVGYASRSAARSGAKPRPRLTGKTIIALTASRRYAIRGVRAGSSVRAMRQRVKGLSRPYRLGRNTWYLAKGSSSRLVFRVRGGRVREIGVADLGVTQKRRPTRRLLRLFDTN